MGFYPIYLRLDGLLCVVVGGGRVAYRKIVNLFKNGAKLRVISKGTLPELSAFIKENKIDYREGEFSDGDLNGSVLVVCATDSPEVNAMVYDSAVKRNLLVNIVDAPEKCNFIVPSVVKRGDLAISISTGGKSPALSKKIRKELDCQFGVEYARFLDIMGELRLEVINSGLELDQRMNAFGAAVESDALELIKMGKEREAKDKLKALLGLA